MNHKQIEYLRMFSFILGVAVTSFMFEGSPILAALFLLSLVGCIQNHKKFPPDKPSSPPGPPAYV